MNDIAGNQISKFNANSVNLDIICCDNKTKFKGAKLGQRAVDGQIITETVSIRLKASSWFVENFFN